MGRSSVILVAILAASIGAAWWYYRNRSSGSAGDVVDAAADSGRSVVNAVESADVSVQETLGVAWPFPRGQEYQPLFDAATDKYQLPPMLLANQGWQESHFRPEIIDGTVQSRAGAVGIMQLIPHFYPGVDPTDPAQAIDAAGKSMSGYYRQFGGWDLALAAYNWGPGNLARVGPSRDLWPDETRNYVEKIMSGAQLA